MAFTKAGQELEDAAITNSAKTRSISNTSMARGSVIPAKPISAPKPKVVKAPTAKVVKPAPIAPTAKPGGLTSKDITYRPADTGAYTNSIPSGQISQYRPNNQIQYPQTYSR